MKRHERQPVFSGRNYQRHHRSQCETIIIYNYVYSMIMMISVSNTTHCNNSEANRPASKRFHSLSFWRSLLEDDVEVSTQSIDKSTLGKRSAGWLKWQNRAWLCWLQGKSVQNHVLTIQEYPTTGDFWGFSPNSQSKQRRNIDEAHGPCGITERHERNTAIATGVQQNSPGARHIAILSPAGCLEGFGILNSIFQRSQQSRFPFFSGLQSNPIVSTSVSEATHKVTLGRFDRWGDLRAEMWQVHRYRAKGQLILTQRGSRCLPQATEFGLHHRVPSRRWFFVPWQRYRHGSLWALRRIQDKVTNMWRDLRKSPKIGRDNFNWRNPRACRRGWLNGVGLYLALWLCLGHFSFYGK